MGVRGVERGREERGISYSSVWDLSMDMDKDEFFPNRKMNKEENLLILW